ISHSITLSDFGFLDVVASRSSGDGASTDAFMTLTIPLGERRTASMGIQRTSDESLAAVASVQKSLPAGSGVGYRVAMSSNADGQLDYAYQGSAGLVGVQYARRNDQDGWRATATGGLAITSVGIMPARTLNESFTVVELADYEGLTVYLDNQPVGRTDQ